MLEEECGGGGGGGGGGRESAPHPTLKTSVLSSHFNVLVDLCFNQFQLISTELNDCLLTLTFYNALA